MLKHPGGAPAQQNLWDREDEVPRLSAETGCARVALQPFHRFGTIGDILLLGLREICVVAASRQALRQCCRE
jgi:hypothetical protein